MHRLLKDKDSRNRQTILALLRHGKTVWNEEGRIQGRQDSPLSPPGKEQVHEWGHFLGNYTIDRILASDMGRVRETVAILQNYCHTSTVIFNPELREQSWGKWEGMTFQELETKQPEALAAQIRSGWGFCPPDGESRRDVLKRVLPVIHATIEQFPGQRVLVVCHEGVVKSLIYHLAGRAFLPEEKKLLQKRQLHLLCGKDNRLTLGPLNILPGAGTKKR
ncbi:MAG: histidine phosphatase family protein [Desulfocapsa sp.]|nr:histidine phosphatase family protein [Desulfocapsa sp.]